MSDKIYLKEITLPIVETGENETYSFVQTDADLDTAGDAADAKKTGDEITSLKQDYNQLSETKADKTANNPSMGSGYASQLVSSLRKSDSVPYNFRKVPYDATLEYGKIVGASVAWNQLIEHGNFDATTVWSGQNGATINSVSDNVMDISFSDNTGSQLIHSFSGSSGHVFFSTIDVKMPDATNQLSLFGGKNAELKKSAKTTDWQTVCGLFNSPYSYWILRNGSGSALANVKLRNCMVTDLTQMLGSTIADYVYSLETATAGSGVAWLKEHFPKQFGGGYQAYNAGEIKSISGLAAHKSVGFNQWDEEWERGSYNDSLQKVTDNNRIRCKNAIPVIGNTTYYLKSPMVCYCWFLDGSKGLISGSNLTANSTFVTPVNTRYILFAMGSSTTPQVTYNHDICISLSKPTGTPKNGDYVAYEEHSYALDSTKTLRGIMKLDSDNKLYADGNVYKADGTVNRRYGVVDLGTLSWYKNNDGQFYASSNPIGKDDVDGNNVVCSKYAGGNAYTGSVDKTICIQGASTGRIWVKDATYNDVTAFKTAVSGTQLVYELATPTTETASPYGNPRVINPDGTESYVYTDGAFELPVGHVSEYPINVSGQLDDILDTPTTNGTYTLQATVTDGAVSYEWVSTT